MGEEAARAAEAWPVGSFVTFTWWDGRKYVNRMGRTTLVPNRNKEVQVEWGDGTTICYVKVAALRNLAAEQHAAQRAAAQEATRAAAEATAEREEVAEPTDRARRALVEHT